MRTLKTHISERGFSLAEALVAILLLSVILIMLYELLIGSLRASIFVESRNDLEVFAQRTVNAVQASVLQSRLLYMEDTTGNGYRQLFIDGGLGGNSILVDSRLPIVDDSLNSTLIPDGTGETFVGNQVIIARALEPVPVMFDHDSDDTTDEIEFLADRYRIEFYFLSPSSRRSFNGSGSYIDIIKSTTEDFADYFQLNSLAVAQRADVADGLLSIDATPPTSEQIRTGVDGPITIAWNPSQPVANAFYTFDNTGTFTLASSPTIDFTTKSIVPEFGGGRLGGKFEYTVCANSFTPTGNGKFGPLGIQNIVPLYGQVDDSFPAGFEVKMIGPSGARSVWNRIVMCSEHMREIDSQESVVITSTREF
jgi:hypothetical protein